MSKQLETLLDQRRDVKAEIQRVLIKRREVEEKIAEVCCPYKLGQLVSFTSKGSKHQAFITMIDFNPTPPYYNIYISILTDQGYIKKGRRVYQPELLTVLKHDGKNDELLRARIEELKSKNVIRYRSKC